MTIPHFFVFASASAIGVLAADEPATKPISPNDSMARVLKTELFDLAEHLGDTSEAGQDHAARLQAAARRIKTEARVSAKSMQRVLVLAALREALSRWEDLELEIVLLQSGGGTMWGHMMQRNDAETEEFLDGIADHLPLVGAEPKSDTAGAIDGLLKGAKKRLAQAKADAAKSGHKSERQAADLSRRLGEAHDQLKWQFQFAGDDETNNRLLLRCRETASVWEAMNHPEKP